MTKQENDWVHNIVIPIVILIIGILLFHLAADIQYKSNITFINNTNWNGAAKCINNAFNYNLTAQTVKYIYLNQTGDNQYYFCLVNGYGQSHPIIILVGLIGAGLIFIALLWIAVLLGVKVMEE